tara:strand:+ start:475 stop:1305 length:831 start_codon:yes stop_codon:yes gene_type:complete
MIAYINGSWVSQNEAVIPINDSAFILGDGLFETIRFEENHIAFLDRHLDRLLSGAKQLRYNLKYNRSEIEKIVFQAIEKNHLKKGIVRIIISRGSLELLDFRRSTQSNLYILLKKLPKLPNLPVEIMLLPSEKYNQREGVNILKMLSYAGNIQALNEAEKHSVFEPIFYNHKNIIKEGATKNIFFIKDNFIFTPSLSLGVLDGIMRGVIIETANSLGIKRKKQSILKDDIKDFDEVFLSSSVVGPMPCTYKNYHFNYSICNQIKDEIDNLYKIKFY